MSFHWQKAGTGRLTIAVLTSLLLWGCHGDSPTVSIPASTVRDSDERTSPQPVRLTTDNTPTQSPARLRASNPEVIIRTSLGDMRARLFADKAPVAVGAFLTNYVARNFYDDLIFHHVDPESVVIGGSYSKDLVRLEPDAPIRNEAHNGLSNRRGTLALTHDRDDAHSANSEFFINVVDNPSLDHQSRDSDAEYGYCVFGEITEGLEVLDRISAVATAAKDDFERLPVKAVVIYSIQQLQ